MLKNEDHDCHDPAEVATSWQNGYQYMYRWRQTLSGRMWEANF